MTRLAVDVIGAPVARRRRWVDHSAVVLALGAVILAACAGMMLGLYVSRGTVVVCKASTVDGQVYANDCTR